MPVIVQKFGGSSVADASRIHLAARRAVRALLGGNQVVLVVSAMGGTTDKLVELAAQVSRRPAKREMDMLLATGEQVSIALMAMAIHEAGYEAVSLTGAQVGLVTDSTHTRARIQSIDTPRLQRVLAQGKIVIVAGFQGVDRDFNITTLGRGGSDTTAVALAAALQARACEIHTDVDGIYTADPRLVPQARKLDAISYDEMLEMAALGAGVMHARAIELGKKYGVPIHVRGSSSDNPGTMIMNETPGMEGVVVRGATLKRDITRVTLAGLPNEPGVTAAVFEAVAEHGILVDDIMQTLADGGEKVTLGFTVEGRETGETRAVAELVARRFNVDNPDIAADLARISVVGVGMRSHAGVAARMFNALAAEKIKIENIATSEIVISVLVPADDGERALQVVHQAFELDQTK
ncbi:MAG: aspartate kinase [Phycisphaerae bacterium]|nr:aspartate kinase [Phycisphaerae bacterium]